MRSFKAVYIWIHVLFSQVNSSNLPLEPEDTPIGYLGVELEGWKLCSPENVCMDVVKIKDGADGEPHHIPNGHAVQSVARFEAMH